MVKSPLLMQSLSVPCCAMMPSQCKHPFSLMHSINDPCPFYSHKQHRIQKK